MKVIRKIQFTGKNLNDVFALPCVLSITKIVSIRHEETILVLRNEFAKSRNIVNIGETLIEYDDGTWEIVKSNGC